MGTTFKTNSELLGSLHEHIQFLQISAKNYDAGFQAEAKRLAVALRVLVHDTKKSQSLLQQLDIKNKLYFLSMAVEHSETNLLTEQNLVYIKLTNTGTSVKATYLPHLSEGEKHFLPFNKWWKEEVVIKDYKRNLYSRKQLVMLLANKDGGAHIDPEISEEFKSLKNPYTASGWAVTFSNKTSPLDNDLVCASVRQMAFEMLHTLFPKYPEYFEQEYF